MKILILEDNEFRINTFNERLKEKFEDCELFFVNNIEDAIKYFDEHNPFDLIFLDHDLDGRVYVDSSELNTGYQFAKYLNEKLTNSPIIIIHTLNPVGAENMANALQGRKITYVPFTIMEGFIKERLNINVRTFKAPWTEEQIKNLQKRQNNMLMHPYTCGNCSDTPLIPTKDGWICKKCDYTQNWAHKSDVDGKIA